jgi:hypothetical protein
MLIWQKRPVRIDREAWLQCETGPTVGLSLSMFPRSTSDSLKPRRANPSIPLRSSSALGSNVIKLTQPTIARCFCASKSISSIKRDSSKKCLPEVKTPPWEKIAKNNPGFCLGRRNLAPLRAGFILLPSLVYCRSG